MTNMIFRLATFLLTFVPLAAGCSSPPDRYQAAVVHVRNALPCFGVHDSEEVRRVPAHIAGVRVTESLSGTAALIWEVSYVEPDGSGPDLSPGDCIVYGDDGSPAQKLKEGSRYRVAILGDMEKAGAQSEVRWYTAYFCMVERNGVLEPHQVGWDKQRNEWAWSECGRAAGP